MTNSVFLPISTSLVSRLATHIEIANATAASYYAKQLNATQRLLNRETNKRAELDIAQDRLKIKAQHPDCGALAQFHYQFQAHKLVNQRAQNLLIRAQRLAAKKIKDQEGRARALELIAA